jgi:ElaB/YqjD/DUF883 family membrane-anchored ribosome-binding protein
MKNRHNAGRAETPEEVIEHITRLMAEAEAMIAGPIADKAGNGIGELKERLGSARDRLNDAYEAARESLGEAYDQTRKQVVAGAKYTDETIRKNPYQSIAIAVGVGVVIGLLLRRNND